MSSTESMATPALPTSPVTRGGYESYPREVAPVEGVRLLGGGEAGVLADRPGAIRVHRRPRAADVGRFAGDRVDVLEAFEVGGGVEGLDPEAVGGFPEEAVGIGAAQILGGELLPACDVGTGLGLRGHAGSPVPLGVVIRSAIACDGLREG